MRRPVVLPARPDNILVNDRLEIRRDMNNCCELILAPNYAEPCEEVILRGVVGVDHW